MAEMSMTLTSESFSAGAPIPARHTCDGENISPPLQWVNLPGGTRSFALIVDDPDAPRGTFTHWVLFDVPVTTTELKEETLTGTAGRNDFQKNGYGGPCPPAGHGDHRYFFRLFALDVQSLGLNKGATRQQVEKAMEGHVLESTELMGLYQR